MMSALAGGLVVYAVGVTLLLVAALYALGSMQVSNHRLRLRAHGSFQRLRRMREAVYDREQIEKLFSGFGKAFEDHRRRDPEGLEQEDEDFEPLPNPPEAEEPRRVLVTAKGAVNLPVSAIQEFLAQMLNHNLQLKRMVANTIVSPLISQSSDYILDEAAVYSAYPDYKKQAESMDGGGMNVQRFLKWLLHRLSEEGRDMSSRDILEIRKWVDNVPELPEPPGNAKPPAGDSAV
jgi:hypothetical protein